MCGIAGILSLNEDVASPAEPEVRGMIDMLGHRGPDGTGFYTGQGVALGHSRLSIIDLATGDQPIRNADGRVWTVFNGEIFNYVELRQALEGRGYRFYTQTDTEVIVHLYDEFGDSFVDHLNGQFAIALWDERRRRLLLVRDRVGIAPLYFTVDGGRLLFASEVKGILPALGRAPRLDASALDQLMTFWAPVSPQTLFEGIEEVSPGQMVIAAQGRVERRQYWDWRFPEDGVYRAGRDEDLADELRELLLDATRVRLRADLPVGAYLSGGLDSSALVSMVHGLSEASLQTFSIGFEDAGLDETGFQQEMMRHLGTDHRSVRCTDADIAARFPAAIWHAESAVLRTAPVPMGILSGLVRDESYKVVLTGEGADEVLGGYDIFKEAKIRQFWARDPDSRLRPLLLKRLYPYLNLTQAQGQAYLKNFFGIGLDRPDAPFFSHLPRWDTTAKCKMFFSDGLKQRLNEDATERLAGTLPAVFQRWHPFNRGQYLEAKSLMAGYLLSSQGDRMLMSNSVEGRFPFLDHRLIEFANTLDPRVKMRVLNEKYLLKRAMRERLPQGILRRKKQPYRAPDIPAFFRDGTPDYVDELLSAEKLGDYGYFDPDRGRRLVEKARRGRAIGYGDNMAFVGMLSTQLWHHHFIERYAENFQAPSIQTRNKRVTGV